MKNKTPTNQNINKENLEEAPDLITDNDIVFVNGEKDDFLGRWQMKLNRIKEKFQLLFKEDK